MKPKIEIVKPLPGSTLPQGIRSGEHFNRGERVILVDGVRWGRTVVTWHGCHGTRTGFRQEGGGDIQGIRKSGLGMDVTVRSANDRKSRRFIDGQYKVPADFKTTDELVAEKVAELVASGLLRHPSIVTEENDKRSAREAKRVESARVRESEEFRNKAIEALGGSAPPKTIDAVVAVMRWAQSQ